MIRRHCPGLEDAGEGTSANSAIAVLLTESPRSLLELDVMKNCPRSVKIPIPRTKLAAAAIQVDRLGFDLLLASCVDGGGGDAGGTGV